MGRWSWVVLLVACGGEPEDSSPTNRPPGAPTLEVVPVDPLPGEQLTCRVLQPAEDPDGDPVSVALHWTVNGTERATGPLAGEGETLEGEIWTCHGTASDGVDTGPESLVNVAIRGEPCPILVETTGSEEGVGSEARPFATLEAAVASAGSCLDIEVGPGTFAVNQVEWGALDLKIRSREGLENTILQGNGSQVMFRIAGGQTTDARVDGFTFTGGYGGIAIGASSNPEIRNNRFENIDKSGAGGGAILVGDGSAPEVHDNEFVDNQANNGGAISVGRDARPHIHSNLFSGNASKNGGAIYNSVGRAIIEGNTFAGNTASDKGGAVSNHSGSQTQILGNIFRDNVGAFGGGVHCHGSTLTMSGNSYARNSPAKNYCSGTCTGCADR